MCVIALAYQTAACGPLLVAANRDEYYARPTAALDFWRPEHPDAPNFLRRVLLALILGEC